VHQLFFDFKKAYDSVRRQVLYNIFIEFGIPMKLVKLINMYFILIITNKTNNHMFEQHLYLTPGRQAFV